MRWYGFKQEPKDGESYVYEPDNGISRFVIVYHHSGSDAYSDYLAGYGEVGWEYIGSADDEAAVKNFDIGAKILPNGSYEMFAHDEFGRIEGFYKGGKTEFITDGYGMKVGILGCSEIFPVDKGGIDEHDLTMTPAPDSIISKNVPVTVNSTGLRVYKDGTNSTQYKMLWSKDREVLEDLREEVEQVQDNIKDLLEEIDEKVMFS